MSHTPGPWKVRQTSKPSWDEIFISSCDREVCRIYTVDRETSDADESNADLISAAPELLAACEYALRFWEETGMSEEFHPSVPLKLKAAIYKAKGEE